MKNEKKVINHCGTVTDSNFEPIHFTLKQAITFAREHTARLNKELSRVNVSYRYKFVAVKDCGDHWNYSIV
jgi:hypothetical protein